MKKNYNEVSEIIVKTQKELDAIPLDFKGQIYIESDPNLNIIVTTRYYKCVEVRGHSYVEARNNSYIEACDKSSIAAYDNSCIVACGHSTVLARDSSSVIARITSSIIALDSSSIVALDSSSIVAHDNSSIVAQNSSSIEAWDSSSIVAYGNSSIEVWGKSSIVAYGNTQVVDRLFGSNIKINGNARIVYMPKTILEYCNLYNISYNEKNGKFYTCVYKQDNKYFNMYDRNYEYKIGKKLISNSFDRNIPDSHKYGIDITHLNGALDTVRFWNNLVILELEVDLDNIVINNHDYHDIRCGEAIILREVPLEECGVYGKILLKRMNRE
jgi:hypothetical protein